MDKEFTTQFKFDGGRTTKLYHANFALEAAVPRSIDLKKEDYAVKPAFRNLLDIRNKLHLQNNGKKCVWAMMNPENPNKYLFLI